MWVQCGDEQLEQFNLSPLYITVTWRALTQWDYFSLWEILMELLSHVGDIYRAEDELCHPVESGDAQPAVGHGQSCPSSIQLHQQGADLWPHTSQVLESPRPGPWSSTTRLPLHRFARTGKIQTGMQLAVLNQCHPNPPKNLTNHAKTTWQICLICCHYDLYKNSCDSLYVIKLFSWILYLSLVYAMNFSLPTPQEDLSENGQLC